MVEGVVVLPFFIIALAAVIFLHRSFAAKLDASVQARSCAWAYSIGGCDSKAGLPEGCNLSSLHDQENPFTSFDDDPVLAAEGQKAFGQNRDSAIDEGLSVANGVGLSLLGLRDGIASQPTRTLETPSLLGGGRRHVAGNYSVMCNEVPMGFLDIVKKMYCALDERVNVPGC